jgi:hypothetical protein
MDVAIISNIQNETTHHNNAYDDIHMYDYPAYSIAGPWQDNHITGHTDVGEPYDNVQSVNMSRGETASGSAYYMVKSPKLNSNDNYDRLAVQQKKERTPDFSYERLESSAAGSGFVAMDTYSQMKRDQSAPAQDVDENYSHLKSSAGNT